MRAHGHKTGLIGTINMKIGDETFEVKKYNTRCTNTSTDVFKKWLNKVWTAR